MLAAGCAVGLGNVWRFPYVVGQNGGAAFVMVYLAFLVLFGFPLLTAELALGRAARRGIAGAMRELAAERYRRFWSVAGMVIFAAVLAGALFAKLSPVIFVVLAAAAGILIRNLKEKHR